MQKLMESWRKTTDKLLVETTFKRIAQKVQEQSIPFVVLSADRHEKSTKENERRNKQMKQIINKAGYPFADIVGSFVEKDDEGNEIRVTERSVIIYDEQREDVPQKSMDLFDLGKLLSKNFEQQAFIFGEPGSLSKRMSINAYDQDGNPVDYGGPWHTIEKIPDDASFWSKVRGTTFVFKERNNKKTSDTVYVESEGSMINAMIESRKNKGKRIVFIKK